MIWFDLTQNQMHNLKKQGLLHFQLFKCQLITSVGFKSGHPGYIFFSSVSNCKSTFIDQTPVFKAALDHPVSRMAAKIKFIIDDSK